MSGAPLELPFDGDTSLELTHVKLTEHGADCTYRLPFSTTSVVMRARQIEEEFHKRTKNPRQPIVVQGKYECMPAAVAMCTGHSLFTVKRAMGMHGWRNDNSGASWEPSLEGVRSLGFDMIWLNKERMYSVVDKVSNAVVTVPSLNLKGRAHAISWVNGEILDPNIGYPGRKSYGPEWTPWTIGARGLEVLLKPMSKIQYQDLLTVVMGDNYREIQAAIVECAA